MSRFNPLSSSDKNADINRDLKGVLASQKIAIAGPNKVLGLESFTGDGDYPQEAYDIFQNLKNQIWSLESLNASKDFDVIKDICGKNNEKTLSEYVKATACEAAALSIMAMTEPTNYLKSFFVENFKTDSENTVVVNNFNYSGRPEKIYASEGFELPVDEDHIVTSAAINYALSVGSVFQETFFPTVIIPPGSQGLDIKVTELKVLKNTLRTADGKPMVMEKIALPQAMFDPSLLKSPSIDVVPYADPLAHNTEYLVATADVTPMTMNLAGSDVTYSPILFGKEVDLIGLSEAPGLISNGVFNRTDVLSTTLNVGKVYWSLTATDLTTPTTTETAAFEMDVSGQPFSMLVQKVGGSQYQWYTSMTGGYISFSSKDLASSVRGGDGAALVAQIRTNLGLAGTVEFVVSGYFDLTMDINTETATTKAYANRFWLDKVFDITTDAANPTEIVLTTNQRNSLAITALGYIPRAKRTNSNFRTLGQLIDNNMTFTYRFQAKLGDPIWYQAPTNAQGYANIREMFEKVQSIKEFGMALDEFASLERLLRTNANLPINGPTMANEIVKKAFLEETVDVNDIVLTMNSKDALANLQGQLIALMSNMVEQLLKKSNYLAAVRYDTGDESNFEVIIATDPQIHSYLLYLGDQRTFGENRKYTITSVNTGQFNNKIYFSFRLTNRPGLHRLNFGVRLFTPGLLYDVNNIRNGAVVKETQFVPKTSYYTTLPILGVITLTNLSKIFTIRPASLVTP